MVPAPADTVTVGSKMKGEQASFISAIVIAGRVAEITFAVSLPVPHAFVALKVT